MQNTISAGRKMAKSVERLVSILVSLEFVELMYLMKRLLREEPMLLVQVN